MGVQSGVNPRTGCYTCTVSLTTLKGNALQGPDLPLSLIYDPLNLADSGYGLGWSLALSQYDKVARTLSLSSGESFTVCASGGNLSMPDQKWARCRLQHTGSEYKVTHKTGLIEYLSDNEGLYDAAVPVRIVSPAGHELQLIWLPAGASRKLQTVKDGTGRTLFSASHAAAVTLTCFPGTRDEKQFVLTFANKKLAELKLALDGQVVQPLWSFTYKAVGVLEHCLTGITYPTGLQELATHKAVGHLLPPGAPFPSLPYVTSLRRLPGYGQPEIVTTYSFSAQNFLGYGSSFDWQDGEDNLYQAANDYEYSSTERLGTGDASQQTERRYNKFHLMLSEKISQSGNSKTTTIEYCATPNTDFANQPPTFQLPKTIRVQYLNARAQAREEVTSHIYDNQGNELSVTDPSGIRTDRVYYPAAGSGTDCPADPNGFQRFIQSETVTPADSPHIAPVRIARYTYVALDALGGAGAKFVLPASIEHFEKLGGVETSLSRSTATYLSEQTPDLGRLQKTRFVINGEICSVVFSYRLAGTTLTQTKTVTGFDQTTTANSSSFSCLSGLTVESANAKGVRIQYAYDILGRILRGTASPATAFEATRSIKYRLPYSGDGTTSPTTTLTDAAGVHLRLLHDGLGRVFEVEQQDDDGDPANPAGYDGTFRIGSEIRYDTLGRQTELIEVDWLHQDDGSVREVRDRTTFSYDGWGRQSAASFSDGHTERNEFDPVGLTTLSGIEGEGWIKTTLDLFGNVVRAEAFSVDGISQAVRRSEYDGLGRRIVSYDASERATRYAYDAFDRVTHVIRPGGSVVSTQYAKHSDAALPVSVSVDSIPLGSQEFDGLSRLTRRTVGGRTQAFLYASGADTMPTRITTPRNETLALSYEPQLGDALTQVSASGIVDHYEYDPRTGTLTKATRQGGAEREMRYSPTGLLTEEHVSNGGTVRTATYRYSVDGKLQAYVDVFGNAHEAEFDELGRLSQLNDSEFVTTLAYDAASRIRTITTAGQSGTGPRLGTTISYDDFGRAVARTLTRDDLPLTSVQQIYNRDGQIAQRITREGGTQIRDERYAYDALGRLSLYGCSGSQLTIDHNGNAVVEQVFDYDALSNITSVTTTFQGGTDTASHRYSPRDPTQLLRVSHTHADYPAIDLSYDEAGNLTGDEAGRTLHYDALEYLTQMDLGGVSVGRYHYDALGFLAAQTLQDGTLHELFYCSEALVNESAGSEQITYFKLGNECLAQRRSEGPSLLVGTDLQQSPITVLDADSPGTRNDLRFTPYGYPHSSAGEPGPIGFNGERLDPVTGTYLLGNGYRAFNPILMRFHASDSWGPFGAGDMNAYAYCLGDPVNHTAPHGHAGGAGPGATGIAPGIGSLIPGLFTFGASAALTAGFVARAVVGTAAIATGLAGQLVEDINPGDQRKATRGSNPSVLQNFDIAGFVTSAQCVALSRSEAELDFRAGGNTSNGPLRLIAGRAAKGEKNSAAQRLADATGRKVCAYSSRDVCSMAPGIIPSRRAARKIGLL